MHEIGIVRGPKYSDGEIEVGHTSQFNDSGLESGPRRAHIRLRGHGPNGQDVVLTLSPTAFAGFIADAMDVAHCLGGHYRDALISKTRYRQRRNN